LVSPSFRPSLEDDGNAGNLLRKLIDFGEKLLRCLDPGTMHALLQNHKSRVLDSFVEPLHFCDRASPVVLAHEDERARLDVIQQALLF
jgi:hypothetical protein